MINRGSESDRTNLSGGVIGSAIKSDVKNPATAPDPTGINQVGSDEWIGAKQLEITDLAGGCMVASTSAVLSCVLLVINGALVMALLSVVAASGQSWIANESLGQFLLFSLPVVLLVIQWRLVDTLRWILRKRSA